MLVMFGTGAGRNVVGDLQRLMGEQLGASQLYQREGATNLADALDRALQQAAAVPFDNESLEMGFSFLDGREQLFADQAQSSCSGHHGALRLLRHYNLANAILKREKRLAIPTGA
ncbi:MULTISPECIES: hypothetical protein [Pseudomonas]|jgi:hypothetical protein|uniref:Uncharacterized protein n=1 Tax=Pseudomonas flavocrustae TaxID=2991719 RepID=A0ABT6IF05_9PSED|nr:MULTISPECIES: hypothetical protein [unclassified Pseudomonas]MDH4762998.1 hypothetical protein [Pseudomonas sp. CBMAI 2609]